MEARTYKYGGFSIDLLGGTNGYGEVAQVLAGYGQNLTGQSWRSPSDATWWYLTKLGEWGYTLSGVGRIITDR